MKRRALITGITGQDGSYLAELLLEKGYEVYGVVRRSSAPNLWRIEHIARPHRAAARPTCSTSCRSSRSLDEVRPRRVLQPGGDVVRAGVVGAAAADRRVQRAGRDPRARSGPPGRHRRSGSTRRRRARCSARCGRCRRREATPFYPRSPYGVSKVYGHYITVNYRESYDLFACSGILFNHESPRRGLEFVTRKVTDGVARIKLGLAEGAARWATSTRSATGASPATTCARCGSMLQQDAAGRLRHRHRRDALGAASWSRWRSATSGSTGRSTSKLDPALPAPGRSRSPDRRRRRRRRPGSAGRRRSTSPASSR